MTLVLTSLPLARAFFVFFYIILCLFSFTLIGGNLTAQSAGSHRRIGGRIQIPEKKLQALLPFPTLLESTPESLLAG